MRRPNSNLFHFATVYLYPILYLIYYLLYIGWMAQWENIMRTITCTRELQDAFVMATEFTNFVITKDNASERIQIALRKMKVLDEITFRILLSLIHI